MPHTLAPASPVTSQPVGTTTASAALLESLERSKAQAEAGLSVPLEPVLDELRASIARMEAKREA